MKPRKLTYFWYFLLILTLAVVSVPLENQVVSAAEKEIHLETVEFEGLDLWQDQGVESVVAARGLVAGETFTKKRLQQLVAEAVDQLQQEDLFRDIRVEIESGRLIFKVEEYPRLEEIKFEGNSEIADKKLKDALLLQSDQPVSAQEINRARRDLSQFYRMRGYFRATVEVTRREVSPGQVAVSFIVDEGRQKVVTGVYYDFERINILTRIHRVWGIGWKMPLREGAPYSSQSIQGGVQVIRNWYQNRGHMEVQVEPKVFHNKRENGYDVLYRISEGPVFRLNQLELSGNSEFSDTKLLSKMPLSSGDVFSRGAFQEGLQAIEDHYNSRGYVDARVMDQRLFNLGLDREAQLVNVSVNVVEGEPFYVDRIEIHGNRRTYDRVIRRELRLREGDLLEGVELQNSRRRLLNLGFFEDVQIDLRPGDAANEKVVRVKVKEGSTGHMQFGGGYSSATGFTGQFKLEKDNFSLYDYNRRFTGRGKNVKISMNAGQKEDSYRLSWNDPWINDSVESEVPPPEVPISFGFSAFSQIYNREENYDETNQGGSLSFGREFGPALSNKVDLEYSFRSVEVSNLDKADSVDIPHDYEREAEGDSSFKRQIGSFEIGLQRDRRNVRRFPSKGYFLRGSTILATEMFGGNSTFYQPKLDYKHYWPFYGPLHWALRFNWKTLDSWRDSDEDPIPTFEKFRLGGHRSIRAYDYRDIMVYDESGNRIGGGKSAFYSNLELRTTLIDQTFQLFVFGDVGAVDENTWEVSSANIKRSVGAGFRIHTPMGPMILSWGQRLDNTYPGADDKGDVRVDFTIGTGF